MPDRRRLRLRLAMLLALVDSLGVWACKNSPPSELDTAPLHAEASGCAAFVNDHAGMPPACVLAPDRRVRLFVPGAGGERMEFRAEKPLSPVEAPRSVPGGRLFTLQIPERAREVVVVRHDASGRSATRRWRLAPPPWPSWVDEAQRLRKQGELEAAERLANTGLRSETISERAAAEGILARIALRRGKVDEASAHFRRAIELDLRAGRVSDRADDAFAFAFMLHQRARRYAEARRVLDDVADELADYPDGQAREPLYRAQLAWEIGDVRSALRLLSLSIQRADRIGMGGIARSARLVRGMVLCSASGPRACLRSLQEAKRELDRVPGAGSCEHVEVEVALGFAELEIAELEPSLSPTARLGAADARALEHLDHGCPDAYLRAIALGHLALAAVIEKDVKSARQRLAQARTAAPEPRVSDSLLWLDIEAQILALEGRQAAALDAFERELSLSGRAGRKDYTWRALLGRGRVLEQRGRAREALEVYRAAERVLDEAVLSVPLGEGRSSAATESSQSLHRAVELLLTENRAAEALDLVRRAGSRVARSLAHAGRVASLTGSRREQWERAIGAYRAAREALDDAAASDWKKPSEELEASALARKQQNDRLRAALDDALALVGGPIASALPPLPKDELVLVVAPLSTHTAVFVAEHARVRAFDAGRVRIDTEGSQLSEQLLAPAAREISQSTRIRVLTSGALAALDVHALPFEGRPLVQRAPIVYGLDLVARPEEGARRALVVSDPTGDLPAARAEGKAVAAALGSTWSVVSLTGKQATAASVRDALGSVGLLHYAGHGVFAGREGAESALPLAAGGALTLVDVLALARVPENIVLSGCEAGRSLGASDEGAAGLAQAFLLAGAQSVVAPLRIVDDRAAGEIARDLYQASDPRRPDLGAALRMAQLRALQAGRPGWEAFRAFVR